MRAMTCPLLTAELKSTNISLTWPETCEPTCTVMTALRVPVAETAEASDPRVTGTVRYT
jgi:hypothetical protein